MLSLILLCPEVEQDELADLLPDPLLLLEA